MAKFINPYNFVPLQGIGPERVNGREETGEKLLTGKIEYTIEILSPLFIPNASNDGFEDRAENEDGEDASYHKSYDFFSYHDLSNDKAMDACHEPVIPGSEIRGAVRSVYEAMTNSCLSSVDEDVSLSKRLAASFDPGVLLKEFNEDEQQYEYRLYAAIDYLYRENGSKDFSIRSYEKKGLPPDGSQVYFIRDEESMKCLSEYANPIVLEVLETTDPRHEQGLRGYLIKGEPGPLQAKTKKSKCGICPEETKKACRENEEKNCYLLEKHSAHVFEKDETVVIKMSEAAFREVSDRMDRLLKIYASNPARNGAYSEYSRTWNDFKNAGKESSDNEEIGIAVYYSIVKEENTDGSAEICYLSPACITREVYRNTLKKILGPYRACNNLKGTCPACNLFGASNGKLQLASKIRFSDAWVPERKKRECSDYYEDPLMLPELSAPKLSAAEFYLRRPEDGDGCVMSWTYDYYALMKEGNRVSVKMYTPKIAGRKFYWHNPQTAKWVRSLNRQGKIRATARNKTVRPLKEGVVFQGELYFEKITKEQLDGLIRILNISAPKEEGKGKYALKLGGAKPLGFGSVAMNITGVKLRTVSFDVKNVYREDNTYDYRSVKLEEIPDASVLTILDIAKIPEIPDFETPEDHDVPMGVRTADGVVRYPYLEQEDMEEEVGFAWFVENRVGLRHLDKERGILNSDWKNTRVIMPSRKRTLYKSYMQPLEPELAEIKPGNPEIGKKYCGTVTDHQEGRAFIRLDDGRMASVDIRDVKGQIEEKDIREMLPKDIRVKLTYLGKEDNDDLWSCEI